MVAKAESEIGIIFIVVCSGSANSQLVKKCTHSSVWQSESVISSEAAEYRFSTKNCLLNRFRYLIDRVSTNRLSGDLLPYVIVPLEFRYSDAFKGFEHSLTG